MDKLGNGGKGIGWNTEHEVEFLGALNGVVTDEGPTKGLPRIETDIDAAEVDPEPGAGDQRRGRGQGLGGAGRSHRARAHASRAARRRTRRSASATSSRSRARSSPRRPGPGIESEKVCYNAGYTNVHELIPWRTLTGRQQLYQDHLWMRAFGEALVRLSAADRHQGDRAGDRRQAATAIQQIVLNFITPHQKWGIHSHLHRQPADADAVSRGGPIVWISEIDAQAGRHRRQRLDRGLQRQRRAGRARRRLASASSRACA